jgi:DNA repair protein RadC
MKHKIAEIKIAYRPNKMRLDKAIVSSSIAYEILLNNWNRDTIELYEEFKVLLLNNSNEVLGIYKASQGGITGTLVDLRLLFATILKSGATAIITAHNHPSGKLKPSEPDIRIFKKIKEICSFHEINYLDNLIITTSGNYSFTDECLMD